MRPETIPETMPEPEPVVSKKIAELLVMENGKVLQTVPVDKTIEIGRSPANDVILKEPKVSRKHAEIHFVGGKYILLDLESSNGTFVGGKKITEHTLQTNDEITIGNTKMVFKG
jgi:pSer/pThr/pTyr-binding forkhead associated (FHA) protein